MSEHELASRSSRVTRSASLHRKEAEQQPFFRPPVQPKLEVSQPGDPHEREADEVAEQVSAKLHVQSAAPADAIARSAEPEEESEGQLSRLAAQGPERQRQEVAARIQRSSRGALHRVARLGADRPRTSASLNRRPALARSAVRRLPRQRAPPSPGRAFQQQLASSQGSGRPLAKSVRRPMEGAFGTGFDGVRVHTDSRAAQMSRSIGAQAFTYRNHVYFDQGRYEPGTSGGSKLLAHELTHVVQQGGDVRRRANSARAPPKVQRLLGSIRNRLADYAQYVPGYTLFTLIIGYDPIRGKNVERSGRNLVRGLLHLIPGIGPMIFDRLEKYGVIERAGELVQSAIASLGIGLSKIERLVGEAWDRMDFIRLDPIAHNKRVLIDTFAPLYEEVKRTITRLVSDIVGIIKEVLIGVLRGLAQDIGGRAYELLTMVLGRDPITGEAVETSTVMVIEAFLRLIGKERELEKMREHGTIQRTADWIDAQLALINFSWTEIVGLFSTAWNSLSVEDLWNPLDALRRVGGIFAPYVERVLRFAVNVASAVIGFIKDILLGLARRYAHRIPGYPLFAVLLGRDPVTGEAVPRTAHNFVRGFLSLVPGGLEKYAQLEESGAIDRTMAWLEEQIQIFDLSWERIRGTFSRAWDAVGIEDIMNPIEAFKRIVGEFRPLVRDIVGFAGSVLLKVLEIIFEAVMGAAGARVLEVMKRGRDTFELIIRDPIGFLSNLLDAVKGGFQAFKDNIWDHLREGLVDWLFGTLGEMGIEMPARFDLRGILSIILQVLGISYARIRGKLVDRIGEPAVARLEAVFDFLRTLVTEGPGAAWQQIVEHLGNVKDTILEKVRSWVVKKIVTTAIARLATMFNPVGAVLNAILVIYNTVQFFLERIRQIAEVVGSIVDSVHNIAIGALGEAIARVENTLAGTIPLVISFLANLMNLGGITAKIREIIGEIQERVDGALERVVDWIVETGGRFLAAGREAVAGLLGWDQLRRPFRTEDGEQHEVSFAQRGGRQQLMIASDPQPAQTFLNEYKQRKNPEGRKLEHWNAAQTLATELQAEAAKLEAAESGSAEATALQESVMKIEINLTNRLRLLLSGEKKWGQVREKYRLEGMVGTFASMPRASGDRLTPDHQPQNAILEWCAEQPYFHPNRSSGGAEMTRRSAKRSAQAITINLHENRHMPGRTYGGKGSGTKNAFIVAAEKAVKGRATDADRRAAVVSEIDGELGRDVAAILEVIGEPMSHDHWRDVDALDFGAGAEAESQKKQLYEETKGQIESGEGRIRSQNLSALR